MVFLNLIKKIFIIGIPIDIFSIINIGEKGITVTIISIIMMSLILFANFKFKKNIVLLIIFFILFWLYYAVFLPFCIMESELYFKKSFFSSLYAVVFFVVVIFFSKYGNPLEDIRFFMQVSFLVAIFGIYQFIARKYNFPLDYLPITNASYHNVSGSITGFNLTRDIQPPYWNSSSTFLEPSYFGRYLVFSIFFYLFLVDAKVRVKSLYLYIFMIALVTTFSLGAFIVMLTSFIVYLLCSKKINLKYIILITLSIFSALSSDVFQRKFTSIFLNFTNPEEVAGSYSIRIQGTLQAIEAFYQYPIAGSGFSVYKLITNTPGTDSQFFEILYQFGIMGLILYLAMLFYFYYKYSKYKMMIFLIFIYMFAFNGLWDLLYAFIFGLIIKSQKRANNVTN